MVKRVSIFSLPEETSGDEFWKYWRDVHAPAVKELAGSKIKKYVINRVITEHEKEIKFWGLIETWWDSPEDYHSLFVSPEGKEFYKEFWDRIEMGGSVFMEELEIPV